MAETPTVTPEITIVVNDGNDGDGAENNVTVNLNVNVEGGDDTIIPLERTETPYDTCNTDNTVAVCDRNDGNDGNDGNDDNDAYSE